MLQQVMQCKPATVMSFQDDAVEQVVTCELLQ